MKERNIYIRIWEEFSCEKSMIFLTGPRQAGKTTLARMISDSYTNHLYFNWDIPEDQVSLVQNPSFFESVKRRDSTTPLIILDEIHKYRHWKNYLKGVYDKFHGTYQFLVSGSGRLDIYQKGGDSLAGRYLLFHLWPFTIAELGNNNLHIEQILKNPLKIKMEGIIELHAIWNRLAKVSGFPEPYLTGRTTAYRRWSNTYSRQLIREDIRDLTGVKSIKDMETLYYLLPSRTGRILSIPSLSRDLKVSYNSVQSWLSSFERFFLIFSISPWTKKISRAIQKERKVYLWDFPRIEDPAARFENMVAMELWRAVTAWNDLGYGRFELHFIKNKEQQEVDFLIANEHKPFLLIETKLTDMLPSAALKKFQSALGIPAVQLVNEGVEYSMLTNGDQRILVAPAFQWLSQLS